MYEFSYDGTIEGLLCVIIRCINMRIMPSTIRVGYSPEHIKSNYALADRMYKYIGLKSSAEIQQMIIDCFLTCLPDREKAIYLMIYKALKSGAVIAEDYSDEHMKRIQMAIRDLYREGQSLEKGIAWTKYEDTFISIINPRNNVLPIIKSNLLCGDKNKQLIFDKRHNLIFYNNGRDEEMVDISMLEMVNRDSLCGEYLYSCVRPYLEENFISVSHDYDEIYDRRAENVSTTITGMRRTEKYSFSRADSLTRMWYRIT